MGTIEGGVAFSKIIRSESIEMQAPETKNIVTGLVTNLKPQLVPKNAAQSKGSKGKKSSKNLIQRASNFKKKDGSEVFSDYLKSSP